VREATWEVLRAVEAKSSALHVGAPKPVLKSAKTPAYDTSCQTDLSAVPWALSTFKAEWKPSKRTTGAPCVLRLPMTKTPLPYANKWVMNKAG